MTVGRVLACLLGFLCLGPIGLVIVLVVIWFGRSRSADTRTTRQTMGPLAGAIYDAIARRGRR